MAKIVKKQEKFGQKLSKVLDGAVKTAPRVIAGVTGAAVVLGMAGCPVEAPAEKQEQMKDEIIRTYEGTPIIVSGLASHVNKYSAKIGQQIDLIISINASYADNCKNFIKSHDQLKIVIEQNAPEYPAGLDFRIISATNGEFALHSEYIELYKGPSNNRISAEILDATSTMTQQEAALKLGLSQAVSNAKQIVRLSMAKIQNPGKMM